MSDQQFERAVNDWLEDGSDRTPPSAIDGVLLAVKTTPQERDLGIPWRFPPMPTLTRATGIAAAVLVAVVGTGGLIYLTSRAPSGPGAASAPTPTPLAGITGWTRYKSAVHGFTLAYPADWSVSAAASREWQPGDRLDGEAPYADVFASPEQDTVGLFVWEMPRGETVGNSENSDLIELGPDVESADGLKAWAETFCDDAGASSCATFTQRAVPMCLNAGGDPCRAALLVPTQGEQYAFFVDWGSAMLTSAADRVTVVVVARADSFPSAARYGGSVELLKAILTTMGVQAPR